LSGECRFVVVVGGGSGGGVVAGVVAGGVVGGVVVGGGVDIGEVGLAGLLL
jgi:hypothetical protein